MKKYGFLFITSVLLFQQFTPAMVLASEATLSDKPESVELVEEEKETQYEIVLHPLNGEESVTHTVAAEALLTDLPIPEKEGYRFIGWFTEEELITQWNLAEQPMESDIVLYAGWEENLTIESIQLNLTYLVLSKGHSQKLTYSVSPADTTEDLAIEWTSSNEDVATVDQDGNVTALAAGVAMISVKIGDHDATAQVAVTVPLESIALKEESLALNQGQSSPLTLLYTPEDTTDSSIVQWSSEDESVALVNQNGTVTGERAGTTIITATVGSLQASVPVNVSSISVQYQTHVESYGWQDYVEMGH